MKMLNKRGPRIDPCGTPSSILYFTPFAEIIFIYLNLSKFIFTL